MGAERLAVRVLAVDGACVRVAPVASACAGRAVQGCGSCPSQPRWLAIPAGHGLRIGDITQLDFAAASRAQAYRQLGALALIWFTQPFLVLALPLAWREAGLVIGLVAGTLLWARWSKAAVRSPSVRVCESA